MQYGGYITGTVMALSRNVIALLYWPWADTIWRMNIQRLHNSKGEIVKLVLRAGYRPRKRECSVNRSRKWSWGKGRSALKSPGNSFLIKTNPMCGDMVGFFILVQRAKSKLVGRQHKRQDWAWTGKDKPAVTATSNRRKWMATQAASTFSIPQKVDDYTGMGRDPSPGWEELCRVDLASASLWLLLAHFLSSLLHTLNPSRSIGWARPRVSDSHWHLLEVLSTDHCPDPTPDQINHITGEQNPGIHVLSKLSTPLPLV